MVSPSLVYLPYLECSVSKQQHYFYQKHRQINNHWKNTSVENQVFILSSIRYTALHISEIYPKRKSGCEKLVFMPLSEGEWSRFTFGNKVIGPNTIASKFHSQKATHQGKLRTKNWYDFLRLHQEDTINMCTPYGNTNKACYMPPDTYIGIFMFLIIQVIL